MNLLSARIEALGTLIMSLYSRVQHQFVPFFTFPLCIRSTVSVRLEETHVIGSGKVILLFTVSILCITVTVYNSCERIRIVHVHSQEFLRIGAEKPRKVLELISTLCTNGCCSINTGKSREVSEFLSHVVTN